MSDLPKTWTNAPLSEVVAINPGVDKSKIDLDQPVNFVPMPAVEARTGRIDVREERRFAKVKTGYTPFIQNDVLFAKITPCMENGKMAVVPELPNGVGFGSTEFHVFRCPNGIDPRYVYYHTSSALFRHNAEHNMTGAVGQKRVPEPYLAKCKMPVPPANEQRRIVEKIEELFSELDKGVESLLLAWEQLKLYRQSVIEATLVSLNPKAMYATTLGELIGRIGQGWSPKCNNTRLAVEGEWAIIKTSAVQHLRYDSSQCKPLPPELEPRPNITVQVGDFLMTRKGPRARTGVVCLVRETRERSMLCDTVYRFRCDETRVLPEFLEIVLNAPSILLEINRRKSGISDSGISLNHSKVRSLPLVLPKLLSDQANLVEQLATKLAGVDRIEMELQAQVAKTEALRQSILKQAFSGQLVPQDPSDEPASELLARIKTDAKPAKKTKRKKALA
ncbi:MAG: restriction endonuclease subunit S [Pseudomonadota bacterium]